MNAAEPELRKLVDLELEAANRENPPFHSAHEGYAVILEELDEVKDELYHINCHISCLWDFVKSNNADEACNYAFHIENAAFRLAAEALQVAAMARKFRQLGGTKMDAEEEGK